MNYKKIVIIVLLFASILITSGCSFSKYNTFGHFNRIGIEELCKENKYDEALKDVDDFLKKFPKNKYAISEKAYILISIGKNEEGLVILTDLLENGFKDSSNLNNMSWAYNNLHMHTLANKYIDICLKASSEADDMGYLNKGNALYGLGEYEQAIVYYDKALEKNSRSTLALWGKGLCLYEMKNYERCLTCFQNYEDLGGDHESLNYLMTNSYMELKDFDGAINEFNKQIKINPDNNSAYSSLASIYEQKGDFMKAIDCYDSIIKKSPENADAYYEKSICLARIGKNAEACDNLKLTLKYDEEYLEYILDEPAFDSLKNNKEFKSLINAN